MSSDVHLRNFKSGVAILTVSLASSLLPVAAAASFDDAYAPAQRQVPAVHLSSQKVASGSKVLVRGTAPGDGRKVVVQRRTKRGWVFSKRARTVKGRFEVNIRAKRTMRIRAVAQPHGGAGTVVSPAVTLRTVRQRGTLRVIPPLSGQGATAAVPTAAAQAVATFKPALSGSPILLQQRTGDGWVTVGEAKANRGGGATFDVTPGETYRARSGAGGPRTNRVEARNFDELFADDFDTVHDGSSALPLSWSDQWRPFVPGRTCAQLSPELRRVEDGVLHLRVGPVSPDKDCTYKHRGMTYESHHLYNTQVSTAKSFAFTHGYAAARMKMPSHAGAHSAFWLLPKKRNPGGPDWSEVEYVANDPTRGTEVDVVEYWAHSHRGRQPAIGSYLHWYTSTGRLRRGSMFPYANKLRPRGDTWHDSFHVFSVKWTPHAYEFMVDGHIYATLKGDTSRVPQYLVLSMLTADYELDRAVPGLFDDSAEVDWVRVWGL